MGPSASFICLLLISLASWSDASTYQGEGNNTENDGCIVGDRKIPPGQNWFVPGECARYECLSGRGDWAGADCGKVLVAEPCKLSEEDNTKTYPDCCPHMVCPDPVQNGAEH